AWVNRFAYLLLIGLLLTACAGSPNPQSSSPDEAGKTPLGEEGTQTPPGSEQAEGNQEEEKTVFVFTDTAGKEHELPVPLENVVVINRNTAEAIQVLGAQDKVIATGDTTLANNPYLDYGDLPDVGKTGEVNLELILSLKPQAVFAYTNRPDQTLEDKLEP